MQKIVTYLWFDNQLEEAVNFYTSLFSDSKIIDLRRYPPEVSGTDSTLVTASFQLNGQEFMALNGGPHFKFTEAISLYVKCKDQAEVDRMWYALIADGGEESACGWLKDRFGLSWQIIPERLEELLVDPNPARAQAASQAMFKMQKIDVQALEDAANQA